MISPSTTHIAAYLARIGFTGEPRPDLDTLRTLHRSHVEAISWEGLDAFAGRTTTREPLRAFEKIVQRGRGGWCYEMNGLFAWILEGLGFNLTRLTAGVMRDTLGNAVIGNHLALAVHLESDFLADVGLGSGLIEPIPLAEGIYRQRFATFRLERLDRRWWRFHNQPEVLPPSFDFALDLTDEVLLEDQCRWLQADGGSPFRQHAVVQRYFADRLESLVGSRWIQVGDNGTHTTNIEGAETYDRLLKDTFGIREPEAERIWSQIAVSAAVGEAEI